MMCSRDRQATADEGAGRHQSFHDGQRLVCRKGSEHRVEDERAMLSPAWTTRWDDITVARVL